jgi:hypothetical protein
MIHLHSQSFESIEAAKRGEFADMQKNIAVESYCNRSNFLLQFRGMPIVSAAMTQSSFYFRKRRWTRSITLSGIRKVLYPRENRLSVLPHSITPGSFSNIRRIVLPLSPQDLEISLTE